MDSNIRLAEENGLGAKVLLYFGLNTYYPKSVTELIRDKEEVQPTNKGIMSILSKGVALVKLNNCFYTPNKNNRGKLSDLNSELEVDITDFNGNLPQRGRYIKNVLLEFKEGRELPRLCKYD